MQSYFLETLPEEAIVLSPFDLFDDIDKIVRGDMQLRLVHNQPALVIVNNKTYVICHVTQLHSLYLQVGSLLMRRFKMKGWPKVISFALYPQLYRLSRVSNHPLHAALTVQSTEHLKKDICFIENKSNEEISVSITTGLFSSDNSTDEYSHPELFVISYLLAVTKETDVSALHLSWSCAINIMNMNDIHLNSLFVELLASQCNKVELTMMQYRIWMRLWSLQWAIKESLKNNITSTVSISDLMKKINKMSYPRRIYYNICSYWNSFKFLLRCT